MDLHQMIDGGFIGLLCGGLGCLVYGSQNKSNPALQRKWLRAGFFVEGVAFCLFGFSNIYLIGASPTPTIIGTVQHLRQFNGKYPGSDFDVVSGDNPGHPIHARYNGPLVHNGDTVEVRFVQYDHSLLSLRRSSGEGRTFEIREVNQSKSSYLLSLFGLGFFAMALWGNLQRATNTED
jgi:hypothetical protein